MFSARDRGLVHLQYVGDVPGTPAERLRVGDRLMWNGGALSEVLTIEEASPAYLAITARSSRSGEVRPRRLKKDRLVALVDPIDGRVRTRERNP